MEPSNRLTPPKDVQIVYDEDSASVKSVCLPKEAIDPIRIDPVNTEPKLTDPLTSVKIGRDETSRDLVGDAEKGVRTDGGKSEKESRVRDPIELFLYRSHKSCTAKVLFAQTHVHGCLRRNAHLIKKAVLFLLLLAYTVYFCYAVWYNPKGALVLIILTSLVIITVASKVINRKFGKTIDEKCLVPLGKCFHSRQLRYCRWILNIGLIVGLITFFVIDVCSDVRRVTSCFGIVTFVLIAYLTSKNPSKVKWRPVLWGLALQFLMGIIILRWTVGFQFFKFLGDQVEIFLNYADAGSAFVFGEKTYLHHKMAFKVFPAVIYFSAVISIFYYWGLMQFLVCKIAWMMQLTMGTTAIESLNAATNIFIGMAESVVMLRPFVPKLTKSELHAVMTGGFATVSGSYIALLVEVKATPEHLLSAAIMSAPAALAMAKLSYPETEISKTRTEDDVYMAKTPARNVVEAAANGAIAAIKIVAAVAANLIAILGLVAFLDATLSHLGGKVGFPELSFQLVCSYLFWPVAAIMGVEIQDAKKIARLLGTKVFVDEFISFRDLGIMVENNEVAERSAVIATYACCGFGSIAAVGMYIGALVSIAPQRRGDISEVAFRAVINGNIAGFLTACIAGVLYTGNSLMDMPGNVNSTLLNTDHNTTGLPTEANW